MRNFKLILPVCLFILSISGFSSCGADVKTVDNEVVVTILPLKFLVDKITNNDLHVNVLVPAAASPETYEPTHKQTIEISRSKVVFTTGLIDFENILVDKLSTINNAVNFVDLSDGITTLSGSCSHVGHAHGVDPHIWTSPRLLKVMARSVYENIALLYPDSTHYYDNYNLLLAQLDSLDSYISAKISESKMPYFIIYHPALTYYANDYGIKQVALEQEGKEPSVSYLKQVISQAKADKIKYVFYQSQFSRLAVESVAIEIDAQAVEVDPLSEDVIDNLKNITDLITKQ